MSPPKSDDSVSQGPFDRGRLCRARNRRAPYFSQASFLVEAAASGIAERLGDVKRQFPSAVVLGGYNGLTGPILSSTGQVQHIVTTDMAEAMAHQAIGLRIVADEERLPFRASSLDLIVSPLTLHWVNDLPGCLIQIRHALRPDGLFIGALLGGETLHELRSSLLEAEVELTGGASPRVTPFAQVRDLGSLLQRAGLALPVVDSDRFTVRYDSALALLKDLRNMAGSNGLPAPTRRLRRDVLFRAADIYAADFSDADGRIRSTFEIIYLTAWAPHESQQKPLRPGSARHRLADALGTEEINAGEKAGPGDTDRNP